MSRRTDDAPEVPDRGPLLKGAAAGALAAVPGVAHAAAPAAAYAGPLVYNRADPHIDRHTDGYYCMGLLTAAEDGRTDVLVHHARPYKEIDGDSPHNPDRHTRVQRLGWKQDGTPDFGVLVADSA